MVQGYNNFVSTLKLVRKHRPFAENDNLPKICQPEDHIEVSSPQSTSSDDDEERDVQDYDDSSVDQVAIEVLTRHQEHEAIQVDNKFGDSGPDAEILAAGVLNVGPAMGPNCNLRSIFSADSNNNNKAVSSGVKITTLGVGEYPTS